MVQSVKAYARAGTNKKKRKLATKSGARYLTLEEQAQVATNVVEVRAKHSVKHRGGPMAALVAKWKVDHSTLTRVTARVRTKGAPKLTTRKGAGGRPRTIGEEEKKRIADVLETKKRSRTSRRRLASQRCASIACTRTRARPGGARRPSRQD